MPARVDLNASVGERTERAWEKLKDWVAKVHTRSQGPMFWHTGSLMPLDQWYTFR